MQWQVDVMAICRHYKLLHSQADAMLIWHNGKLMQWQVDAMASSCNCKLMKQANTIRQQLRASWPSGKLVKWQVDAKACRRNGLSPTAAACSLIFSLSHYQL